MDNDLVSIRFMSNFLFSLLLLFGFYVQFHGEVSPGGGFQSGIIIACAFILNDLVSTLDRSYRSPFVSKGLAIFFAASGVIVYGLTGFAPFLLGYNFFDYSAFAPGNNIVAQQCGLMLIEIGVSLTVFGVVFLIYGELINFMLDDSSLRAAKDVRKK